jgi:glycosyltransferase involved in cell wall biosynthesis
MIIKDESKLLDKFLSKVSKYVDEIIIVDTGSKDNSKEISEKYTSKVFDFEWCDDFSKARNFSISKATKEWILWLDPDEEVIGLDKIKELVKCRKSKISEHDQKCKAFLTDKSNLGYRFVQETTINSKKYTQGICKLFQNNKGIGFIYPIHESVRPSIIELKGNIAKSGIIVKNKGNYNLEKAEYYLKLLEKKAKMFPESSVKKEIEFIKEITKTMRN